MAFLLGLPIPQDLEAGPRTDVLDPMFVAAHSMAPVSTWEREGRWTGDDATMPGIGEAMDEEEIDRLRAIGYIQ
jgi:hypothetical protein